MINRAAREWHSNGWRRIRLNSSACGTRRRGARPAIRHWQWGNNPGYRAFVMADPANGSGFVLLTNSDRGLALSEPIANAVLPDAHRVFGFRMLGY